jgi:SAM-dependent methyltransferase
MHIFETEKSPFLFHPIRRYHYAWTNLHNREGKHLDIGCCRGEFLGPLQETSNLECFGVDPHQGYLLELHQNWPNIKVMHISITGSWDFPDCFFSSASALDVLEHVPNEFDFLTEIRRVLKPKGILILSVPQQHLFSFLDPDNAKFKYPPIHRLVYSVRFGKKVYYERFVDLSNGLMGDMSVGRKEHTNYRLSNLLELINTAGFRCIHADGANLFWRLFHIPALLSPNKIKPFFEYLILRDGLQFKKANLFLTLERR